MRLSRLAEEPARTIIGISLCFAAFSAIVGVNMPYLPVWLDWVGLSATEIAVIGAAPMFMRVVVPPVVGFLADRTGKRGVILTALPWAMLAAFLVLAQCRGFAALLAATILFSLVWTPVLPLAESMAISVVARTGADYGRMRLWSSLSFMAANFAGGWAVERLGAQSVVWLLVVLCLLAALSTRALTPTAIAPAVRGGGAGPRPPLSLAEAASLVRRPSFVFFLIATGAVQSAHAVFYLFGILHWRSIGISAEWASVLWLISIAAEVALFAYSRAVLRWLSPVQLIALGSAAAVVRWGVMGIDPPFLLLIPLQLMHALTFCASHIGAIHYLGQRVPEHFGATAQALYSAVFGIAMGAATLATGPLYAAFGARAYWAMAGVAMIGLAASLRVHILDAAAAQPHSSGNGGNTRAP